MTGEDSRFDNSLRRFKVEIFQALAHPTRIAIVELLADGELSAGALIAKLRIEQANASQHLSILRTKKVLISRKVGNQAFYSIRDPIITSVLALMRSYFYEHLKELGGMLDEIQPLPGPR